MNRLSSYSISFFSLLLDCGVRKKICLIKTANIEAMSKVRGCTSADSNKDEIGVSITGKQILEIEKLMEILANDEKGHLNYIKMKLKYLQRKINIHQLKLITNTSSSVTEETENIFDTDVEEALELVTTVRKIVSYRRKRMETHKWKLGQIEFFLMRHDNEELIHFSVELIDTVEKIMK